MGPLEALYVELAVTMGRLMYAFAGKPGHVVRMGHTDQVHGHGASQISTRPNRLVHLDHFACVSLFLLATRKGHIQDREKSTRNFNSAAPSPMPPKFCPRPYGRPASVVSMQLQHVNIRTGMASGENRHA